MLDTLDRIWISVATGIFITLLAILTLPKHTYTVQGLLLPNNMTRPSISPDQVQIYSVMPVNAQSLGVVQMARHYSSDSQNDTDATATEIISKAKQLASAAGANGIYVRYFGHAAPGTPAALAVYVAGVDAFYSSSR